MTATVAGVALRMLDSWGKRELFKGLMRLAWITKTIPDFKAFLPLVPDTTNPNDARTEMEAVADIFFSTRWARTRRTAASPWTMTSSI